MAHNEYDPHQSTWAWTTTAYSNSCNVHLNKCELVGLACPAFETNTAYLVPEVTESSFDVADGSATWVGVYDIAGDQIKIAVGTSARRVSMDIDVIQILAGRMRFKATQSDGSTGVNQDGQSVTPKLKYV